MVVVLFFWVIGGEEELGLVECFLFCFFFFSGFVGVVKIQKKE